MLLYSSQSIQNTFNIHFSIDVYQYRHPKIVCPHKKKSNTRIGNNPQNSHHYSISTASNSLKYFLIPSLISSRTLLQTTILSSI